MKPGQHLPPAVCLLSGGLDSSTCLAIANNQGYACYCLSFDYGQRHKVELNAAKRIATSLAATEHRILHLDLRAFGGSALTSDLEVPKDHKEDQISESIPVTYVPARNTIFLSLALAYAEVISAGKIFIGVNALDYSGYPDCRPEFIEAFERMANLATKAGVEGTSRVEIKTPLIKMPKSEIIQTAIKLGVDIGLTHSCYDPRQDSGPCGHCDSCLLRQRGFREAGVPDPIETLRREDL